MIVYKITANGVTHYTKTGISIWKAVLDKFNIKYEIERTDNNDIPHSDIRRMESEGVYEEKFGEPNFSSHSTTLGDIEIEYIYNQIKSND